MINKNVVTLLLFLVPGLVNAQGTIILSGYGHVAGENIQHPNGNIFNQVLLTGESIQLQAKPGQITRVSFMDEDEDIVQVEFSGSGTFTVTLDPATFLPAALPLRYNQQVEYVTGKPSVVIDGADSSTFFSIFTVGRINAVNQALFPEGQVYDAEADVTLVEVINSTGFGGMQLSNVVFSASTGKVGVDARGVPIAVRLTVGDINASGDAVPHLLFGDGSFTVPAGNPGLRITGGDLVQSNGASIIAISEVEALISQNNFRSDGTEIRAKVIGGSFDFIDRQVQSLVPQSLDGMTFQFIDYDYTEFPTTISFTGHRLGTFKQTENFTLEGITFFASRTGTFNTRTDSGNPNMAHLTFVEKNITARGGGLNISGTIEEVSSQYDVVLTKSTQTSVVFLTPLSGTYSSVTILTDGSSARSSGTFREL